MPRINRRWFFLIMTVFSILLRSETTPHGNRIDTPRMLGGDQVDAYDFPYTCTVYIYRTTTMLGMCTIFAGKWVFTTMNVLHKPTKDDVVVKTTSPTGHEASWKSYNPYQPRQIQVSAGLDFRRHGQVYDPLKENKFYQERVGENTYIVDTSDRGGSRGDDDFIFIRYTSDREKLNNHILKNPTRSTFQLYDLYSYRMNMVFVELQYKFEWNPYVLPCPLHFDNPRDNEQATKMFQKVNDDYEAFMQDNHCVVQGWKEKVIYKSRYGPAKRPEKADKLGPGEELIPDPQQLVFKETAWVTNYSCANAYCVHDEKSCMEYPLSGDLCFQSLSYGDACERDQGTALYCRWFYDSIFGFLKVSLNCGERPNRPAVYTPFWVVHAFWLAIPGNTALEKRPDYNNYRDRIVPTYDQP